MSTNALIGIINDDNSVTSIYNHWDGYPEYLGSLLTEHYLSEEKVRELMGLGDVSVLKPTLEESTFYHRDRNEKMKFVSADTMKSVDALLEDCLEYTYLFSNGAWHIYSGRDELINKWEK